MATTHPIPAPRRIDLKALQDAIRRIEGGFGCPGQRRHVATGIDTLDARLPGGGLAAGAIHELLASGDGVGLWTVALWLARQAAQALAPPSHGSAGGGYILWFDAGREFYPPAACAAGVAPERLVIVRTRSRRDAYWGMDQSLRCAGVAAVVGSPGRLNRAESRRLQLAAEAGGGMGLLLHEEPPLAPPLKGGEKHFCTAAASRWCIAPLPSPDERRRIRVEVVRCRGGGPLPAVVIEVRRDANFGVVSAGLAGAVDSPAVGSAARRIERADAPAA